VFITYIIEMKESRSSGDSAGVTGDHLWIPVSSEVSSQESSAGIIRDRPRYCGLALAYHPNSAYRVKA
jgi:hypothetical protein